MNLEEKQNFLVNCAFFIAVSAIIFFSLKFAFLYLTPFLIGVIIACLIQKPAQIIAVRTKLKKEKCAAVLSVLAYAAVLAVVITAIWVIVEKADCLTENLICLSDSIKNVTQNFYKFISQFFDRFDSDINFAVKRVINDTVGNFTDRAVSVVSNTVTSIIKNIPTLFITSLVTVVATCYIAKDYSRLKQFLKGIISEKICKNAIVIKNIFTESVLKFLYGYLKIAGITFIELSIGFLILGINNFFAVAFIISLIDLLPVFGVGTVMLPWSVILFLQNNIKLATGILILYAVVSIVRNFIEPKIIGKQIGINPLFTLVSMYVGLKTAGIAGMLLFPIVLIVLFSFYRNKVYEG